MAYSKINWVDAPEQTTPVNANNLNHMDNQIKANELDIIDLESGLETANSTISSHTSSISTLTTKTNTNASNISSLTTTVNGHTSSISSLNSTVATKLNKSAMSVSGANLYITL